MIHTCLSLDRRSAGFEDGADLVYIYEYYHLHAYFLFFCLLCIVHNSDVKVVDAEDARFCIPKVSSFAESLLPF